MVAAGDLRQRSPRLDGHMAVGFGRQREDDLGRVDVGVDVRQALAGPFVEYLAIEIGEISDLGLGVPGNALAAIADALHQRAERGEALVEVGVIALDHLDRRTRLAGNQLAFAPRPVLDADRLRQLVRGVVHERSEHHLLLDTQMADAHLTECLRQSLVDLPVAARLPGRIDGGRQRMDERVHVAGVQVVLFVPGRRRQHHVRVQAGRAHAEIERHQQVELAFGGLVVPGHFGRLGVARAKVLALHPIAGAQQMLEEIFMPLAARSEQIGAPHQQVARPVVGVIRIGAAHLDAAFGKRLHRVLDRVHTGFLGVLDDLDRVALQLRRRR